MSAAAIEKLIWTLVYGGMLLMGLGFALLQGDAPWGWGLVACGGAAALVGVVLVFVRARMKDVDGH
jgi:formate hydrogenlyase subunit 3/multisubunit Na+/H+ antiporter MnhD subunit